MSRLTRYDWGGLRDVYLLNGVSSKETAYGLAVAVDDLEGLHTAICRQLARERIRPVGAEIRFMRQCLGLTQAGLGALLCCTNQSVARWEKGEVSVPPLHALALRALVLSRLDGPVDMMRLSVETVKNPPRASRLFFKLDKGRWIHEANAVGRSALSRNAARKANRGHPRELSVS